MSSYVPKALDIVWYRYGNEWWPAVLLDRSARRYVSESEDRQLGEATPQAKQAGLEKLTVRFFQSFTLDFFVPSNVAEFEPHLEEVCGAISGS